jgi:hypothetical protein
MRERSEGANFLPRGKCSPLVRFGELVKQEQAGGMYYAAPPLHTYQICRIRALALKWKIAILASGRDMRSQLAHEQVSALPTPPRAAGQNLRPFLRRLFRSLPRGKLERV